MFNDPTSIALKLLGIAIIVGMIAFFVFLMVRKSRPAVLESDDDLDPAPEPGLEEEGWDR